MTNTIVYHCKQDSIIPTQLQSVEIIKVECETCIGYVDVTEDFDSTMNGNTYKFTYKGENI